jgi:peptidoglycan/xylan/chitin deacetylase (PgdA/CDA1 family)
MSQVTPCTWKHGKRWAYTVTYDEALIELFQYVVPLHERLGMPGHVEVVVGHMGKERRIGNSSYNGWHHMGPDKLRQLIDMGWGVGNHSWSHGTVEENIDLEIRQAKQVLEEAIGHRVTTYVAPGSNVNITPLIVEALRDSGYLCALGVTDEVNRPDCNLWFLGRTSNLHQGWGPLWSAFDPHHRLAQARLQSGWICDYCHCPSPKIPHENKDAYIDEHRARLEAVLDVGGDEVWLATVEEIVDYILCRRHTRVERVAHPEGRPSFRLSLADVPDAAACRQVTLDIRVPPSLCRCPFLEINGQMQPALLAAPGVLRATLDLSQPVDLCIGGASQ